MKLHILFVLLTICLCAKAEKLSELEKDKRKLVSRMYQATDAALIICPESELLMFKQTLDSFKVKYTELNNLLENSIYKTYAVESFSDDIERIKNQSIQERSEQCLYLKTLLESLLETKKGIESVQKYVLLLKK